MFNFTLLCHGLAVFRVSLNQTASSATMRHPNASVCCRLMTCLEHSKRWCRNRVNDWHHCGQNYKCCAEELMTVTLTRVLKGFHRLHIVKPVPGVSLGVSSASLHAGRYFPGTSSMCSPDHAALRSPLVRQRGLDSAHSSTRLVTLRAWLRGFACAASFRLCLFCVTPVAASFTHLCASSPDFSHPCDVSSVPHCFRSWELNFKRQAERFLCWSSQLRWSVCTASLRSTILQSFLKSPSLLPSSTCFLSSTLFRIYHTHGNYCRINSGKRQNLYL